MFNIGLTLFGCGLLLSLVWKAGGFALLLCALAFWVTGALRYVWDRLRGVALSEPAQRSVQRPKARGVIVEDDRPVSLDDSEIPHSIREMVRADMQPGDVLLRCMKQGGARGPLDWLLASPERPLVLEWWLMSAEGELIEVYWLEH